MFEIISSSPVCVTSLCHLWSFERVITQPYVVKNLSPVMGFNQGKRKAAAGLRFLNKHLIKG